MRHRKPLSKEDVFVTVVLALAALGSILGGFVALLVFLKGG